MRQLLIFVFLLLGHTSSAQIIVSKNLRAARLPESYVQQLKNTTTIFTLQDRDLPMRDRWQKAIAAVWKVTPFKLVGNNEVQQYLDKPGYSFFSFGTEIVVQVGRTGASTTSIHLYYDLFMPGFDKEGKLKAGRKGSLKDKDYYARILLYPEKETLWKLLNMGGSQRSLNKGFDRFVHEEAQILNWVPGMLKGYLAVVNNALEQRKPNIINAEFANNDLAALAEDTLYIPDYVNIRYNPFTAEDSDENLEDDGWIKKAYKFPVKLISAEELDRLIVDGNRGIYYLSFVVSSSQKFVNVFYSTTGKMDYAASTAMSFNLKPKDLARLARKLD